MEPTLVLSIDSDDALGDLEDLLDWLRDEPELRRHVSQRDSPPLPGHMGGAADIIIALGSGALGVLATSLRAWLNRPRGSDVDIKVRRPDGEEIEISLKRGNDVEPMLRKLLDPGQP